MNRIWTTMLYLLCPVLTLAQSGPSGAFGSDNGQQPYQPAVPAPTIVSPYGSPYYGYSGGASTAAGSAMNGMANMMSAAGQRNLSNSAAVMNLTQAQRSYIENRNMATNTYFQMRATNKAARAAERRAQKRVASLEAELRRARESGDDLERLQNELDRRDSWIRELEERAATADARADDAEAELETARERLEELATKLAEQERRLAEARAKPAAPAEDGPVTRALREEVDELRRSLARTQREREWADERVRKRALRAGAPAERTAVVGNLVADAVEASAPASAPGRPHVLLFGGSRDGFAVHLVPLLIAVVDRLAAALPGARFVWPVSRLLKPETLAAGIAGRHAATLGGVAGERQGDVVITPSGARLELVPEAERYAHMRAADLAVTIPGTNTLELGVAGVPSLAYYDVWIDAGPSGEDDPANALDVSVELPDGRRKTRAEKTARKAKLQ